MKSVHTKNQQRRRSNRGTLVAEMAFGCLITVFIVLFALDIAGAMMCYGVNDRACRDAARAAAQGSTPAEATELANGILTSYRTNAGPLNSTPVLVTIVYNDFGGNPPEGVSPFVTVTTRSVARPIAPFHIGSSQLIGSSIPLVKTYTFPIVKLTVPT